MTFKAQTYHTNHFIVSFKEDEDAYFYAWKDGESLGLALKILVHEKSGNVKGKQWATYYRKWDTEPTSNQVQTFINAFLTKPNHRTEWFVQGTPFEEVVKICDEKGVNLKCKQAIERFYQKNTKKRKFKDYLTLKTYGLDGYSRLTYEALRKEVDAESLDSVEMAFNEEKNRATCLKWILRGLKVDDAIRKVCADLEVANMIR